MMTQRCPQGDELFGPETPMCPEHICALEPYTPGPEAGDRPAAGDPAKDEPVRESWSGDVCWSCGTPSPNPRNTECLNMACRRSLRPPAMLIAFPDGDVELNPGEQAELGRHGRFASVFKRYPNVSRSHATVGVEDNGSAWIVAIATPNGTFLNGDEIPDSVRRVLRTADSVRFAQDLKGSVRLFLL